jgi:flagellar protein FlaF
MSLNAYATYQAKQTNFEDSRHTEYRLLVQVTAALLAALETPNDIRPRIEAAQWNRDVWAALRIDLMSEANGLPQDLKNALISLARWSEDESLRVISGKGDIDSLIEINRNIMAGLKPADEPKETLDTAPEEDAVLPHMATSDYATALLNSSSA